MMIEAASTWITEADTVSFNIPVWGLFMTPHVFHLTFLTLKVLTRFTQSSASNSIDQCNSGCGIFQNVGKAVFRIGRIEWDICTSCFQDSEYSHDHCKGALDTDRHETVS
jgi:hypothetical protein